MQLLDLARERVAPETEQVRGFDPPAAGVRERAQDQEPAQARGLYVTSVLK